MSCVKARATVIGGSAGVAAMLLVRTLEERSRNSVGLMAAIGIDGLVLALGFAAGEKAGLLLPIEVLFLGLTLVIGLTAGVILLLPVGTLLAWPIAMLPQIYLNGFLSSG